MTNKQIPKEGNHVLVVQEHCADFYGVVVSIDAVKGNCVVEGHEVSKDGTPVGTTEIRTRTGRTEIRTVSLNSIEKINERFVIDRLYNWRGSHPDTEIIVDVSTKRQLAEEDQPRVLWDALKFMSSRAFNSHQKLLGVHAQAIHNATRSLIQEGMSEDLPHIVRDVMALTVPAIMHNTKNEISVELLPFYRLWLAVMLADKENLKTMLAPETFSKFFNGGANGGN